MPQAAFYGDWGRTRSGGPRFCADRNGVEWRLPQQAENRFRVKKALLAEERGAQNIEHEEGSLT